MDATQGNATQEMWAAAVASKHVTPIALRKVHIPFDFLPAAEQRLTRLLSKLTKQSLPLGWRTSAPKEVDGVWATEVEVLSPRTVKTQQGWHVAALIEPEQIIAFEAHLLETVQDIGRCDHCHTVRQRTRAFALVHDDGTRKVVGSSCLKEFTGWNPADVLNDLNLISEVNADLDELGSFGGAPKAHTTEWFRFLAITIEVIKEHGFLSRKMQELQGGILTSARVGEILASDGSTSPHTVDTECMVKAEAITAWLDEQTADNSYMETLKQARALGCVGPRVFGFVASLPHAYKIAMRRLLSSKGNLSSHIGTVGKRETFKATLVSTREFDSEFGIRTLCTFKDAEGNILVWWASGSCPELESGTESYVTGTVKAHTTFRDTKQTVLSRCSVSNEAPKVKTKRTKKAA